MALDELEAEAEADDRLVEHESHEERKDQTDGVLESKRHAFEEMMQRQGHDQYQRPHVMVVCVQLVQVS